LNAELDTAWLTVREDTLRGCLTVATTCSNSMDTELSNKFLVALVDEAYFGNEAEVLQAMVNNL